MKTLGWIIGLCCVAFSSLWAQPVESLIEAGNTSYKAGAYAAADSTYQEALNIAPESYEGAFNRGDALYRQQEYEEAANTFRQLATTTQDPKRKAAAYHNLGNSLFQEKNLEGSIEAYKNALRNDPTDADTRYNLALAQKLLKEQQQNEENKDDQDQEDQEEKDDQEEQQDQENKDDQEKQDQNGDNQEDQQDQQDQQDQENQDQQDQEKQDQQDGENEQNKDGQQDQQEQEEKEGNEGKEGDQQEGEEQEMRPQQVSPQEAERMLEAIEQQERNTQQSLMRRKGKGKPVKIEKDW